MRITGLEGRVLFIAVVVSVGIAAEAFAMQPPDRTTLGVYNVIPGPNGVQRGSRAAAGWSGPLSGYYYIYCDSPSAPDNWDVVGMAPTNQNPPAALDPMIGSTGTPAWSRVSNLGIRYIMIRPTKAGWIRVRALLNGTPLQTVFYCLYETALIEAISTRGIPGSM